MGNTVRQQEGIFHESKSRPWVRKAMSYQRIESVSSELNDAEIAARIDRLPNSAMHRHIILILALAIFFDTVDLNSFASAAPALIHSWGITINQIAFITSASFIGMFFGATIGGWLSDRIGRKTALMTFVAISSLASLATAIAPTADYILLMRVVTGFGLSAGLVTTMTYISEVYPAKSRGRWQSSAMVINLFAIPLTNLFARMVVPYGANGWRWVFIWGALGLVFIIVAPLLPESPRWLARQGRAGDAERVLKSIEAKVLREHGSLPEPQILTAPIGRPMPWTAMFAPRYRARTFALCGIWMLQSIGFYGFEAWVPTLLVKHGFTLVHSLTYFTLINTGGPLGALIAVLVTDRFERKYLIAIACSLIAICGLFYGLTFEPVLIVSFGFLISMLAQTFVALFYSYTPEQFPTDIRNSATGFTYGTGRISNVINAFAVAAIYTHFGYLVVFSYMAAAWVLTALIAMVFGPRTTGQNLEVLNPQL